MALRDPYGIKDRKIVLTCPSCECEFEEFIVLIEILKETSCPACGLVVKSDDR